MAYMDNNQKQHSLTPNITVLGLGGGGGNSVDRMYNSDTMPFVKFITANTDAQALHNSPVQCKIQLGPRLTKGLGAGANPEIGYKAAEESMERIKQELEGSDMVFIAAGMGGGTGSGSIARVAALLKEMGILTVAVVTTPFNFEGLPRQRVAKKAIQELKKYCETVIIIHNQNLLSIANTSTRLQDAFKGVDDILYISVRSIVDLVVVPGIVNCDFADIKNTMQAKGRAMMGVGQASGENRALRAAQAAINNPLLDHSSIQDAKSLLVNITGGDSLTLHEVDEAINEIRRAIRNDDVNIIFGSVYDKNADYIRVSIVATGITDTSSPEAEVNLFNKKSTFTSVTPEDYKAGYINPLWGNAVVKKSEPVIATQASEEVLDNEEELPAFLRRRK